MVGSGIGLSVLLPPSILYCLGTFCYFFVQRIFLRLQEQKGRAMQPVSLVTYLLVLTWTFDESFDRITGLPYLPGGDNKLQAQTDQRSASCVP